MTSLKLTDIHKRYPNRNIGFKATEDNMTCRNFQYELNKTVRHEGTIEPCASGFHLCENFTDVFVYYDNIQGDKRLFIVEYGQDFIKDEKKLVTNELTFLEEIDPLRYIQDNIDSITNTEWYNLSYSQQFSEEFIREHENLVDWDYMSQRQELSEDLIRDFKDKVHWNLISSHQQLSENFIREFKDKVYWTRISRSQKLSEDFIREFKDKVNWQGISYNQKLSEDFIREHSDSVNWEFISSYQTLSEDFIREFIEKIHWTNIKIHQYISKKFIKEFDEKLDIWYDEY